MDGREEVRVYGRAFVALGLAFVLVGAAALALAMVHAPAGPRAGVAAFDPSHLPSHVGAHYAFARGHLDLLDDIPCYCGCEAFLEHRHLADCFVTPGGAWESHAAGCAVCTDEAAMAEAMLAEGRSPPEIRAAIVAHYE